MSRNHLLLPLAFLFLFAGWQSLVGAPGGCSLQVAWAQLGIPSAACPDSGCPLNNCKMQQLEWTDALGIDHTLQLCGCGSDPSPAACLGWLEIIYSDPISVNGDCLFPERCPIEKKECEILQTEDWPVRPAPHMVLCVCVGGI